MNSKLSIGERHKIDETLISEHCFGPNSNAQGDQSMIRDLKIFVHFMLSTQPVSHDYFTGIQIVMCTSYLKMYLPI